jgi:hypothetical protein
MAILSDRSRQRKRHFRGDSFSVWARHDALVFNHRLPLGRLQSLRTAAGAPVVLAPLRRNVIDCIRPNLDRP